MVQKIPVPYRSHFVHLWHFVHLHCLKSCALQLHLLDSSPQSPCPKGTISFVIALSHFSFSFRFHSCFGLLNQTPENSERCFFCSSVLMLPQIPDLLTIQWLHVGVSCSNLIALEQPTDLLFNTASAWVDWPYWRMSVGWSHCASWSSGMVLMRSPIKKGVKERLLKILGCYRNSS